jgi:hypothetical protein
MADDDLLALLAQPPEIGGGFWEREHERMLNPLKEVLENRPVLLRVHQRFKSPRSP